VIVPDVNLLLYAHIDAFAQHEASMRWWQEALSGSDEVGLAAPVVFGFVRIATNPRIFVNPLPIDDAITRVEEWLGTPPVRVLAPGPRHFEIAFDLLKAAGTAGNLTTDAQIAAFAIEYQGIVYSNDTDFGRFPGLRWNNPLAPTSGPK
jgi:toxin-antitoxin system PIN domain toxin